MKRQITDSLLLISADLGGGLHVSHVDIFPDSLNSAHPHQCLFRDFLGLCLVIVRHGQGKLGCAPGRVVTRDEGRLGTKYQSCN